MSFSFVNSSMQNEVVGSGKTPGQVKNSTLQFLNPPEPEQLFRFITPRLIPAFDAGIRREANAGSGGSNKQAKGGAAWQQMPALFRYSPTFRRITLEKHRCDLCF